MSKVIPYNTDIDIAACTWGLELEFGDIPRDLLIPPELGSWEYFETDVVNQLGIYRSIACDPMGINPPVGGEINTVPTASIDDQIKLVRDLLLFFESNGYDPTTSCVSNTHVHVHVPGFHETFIKNSRKLLVFMLKHQTQMLSETYAFDADPRMRDTNTALEYLTQDSGRLIDINKVYQILRSATSPERFYDMYEIDKQDPSKRYAINLMPLRYESRTIEFRCFRSTKNLKQLQDIMRFCYAFLTEALNDTWSKHLWTSIDPDSPENLELFKLALEFDKHRSKVDLFSNRDYDFPRLDYDHELYLGWESTKYSPDFNRKKEHKNLL
jgi:hypothetical protein